VVKAFGTNIEIQKMVSLTQISINLINLTPYIHCSSPPTLIQIVNVNPVTSFLYSKLKSMTRTSCLLTAKCIF